ncbi:hypothetical protein J6590_100302 [Homalodisca vitripennis]|nr:hypothetical protein J6590_100302 [Homalodisca vitripennis]
MKSCAVLNITVKVIYVQDGPLAEILHESDLPLLNLVTDFAKRLLELYNIPDRCNNNQENVKARKPIQFRWANDVRPATVTFQQ